MPQTHNSANKLSNLQLELLKTLNYTVSETQLQEIKSLLRFYFSQQLDSAIEKAEHQKNYSATIYENWLKTDTTHQDN